MMKKTLLSVICLMALMVQGTWGAEFCVNNATDFQTALTTAQSNNEDDIIKVVQGTYSGHFSYSSNEGHSITLLGGYTAGCAASQLDPANTILDGGNTGRPLSLQNYSIGGNVYAEGFTLQHGGGASTFYGAGLFAQSHNDLTTGNMNAGDVTIVKNIVMENNASTSGGGIYAVSTSLHGDTGKVTVTDSIVLNNTSTLYAGGVYAESYAIEGAPGIIILTNNIVSGNSSGNNGGGLYAISETSKTPGGAITVTNNTVTGNTGGSGGGVFTAAYNGSSGGVVNCYNNIIWGNTATTGGDIRLASSGTNNGYNNNYDSTKISGTWTNSGNNINADPLFVGDNDYHLRPSSPCIDAGNNAAPSLPSFDIEGYYRVMDGNYDGKTVVDMGALEYWSNVQCVSTATDLQNALNSALLNGKDDTIKVVQGTYMGTFTYDSNEGHSITLLGGYTKDCAKRVVNPTNTILDANSSDRVLKLQNSNGGDIFLEGFTITNGNVTNASGGGVLAWSYSSSNVSGTVTLSNNIITNNNVIGGGFGGGGVFAASEYDSGKTGDVLLINNIISSNTAPYYGGAFAWTNSTSGVAGRVILTTNIITGNTATTQSGGASTISTSDSGTAGTVTLINNVIAENTAPNNGGVSASSYSPVGAAGQVIFTNNTVTGNTAGSSVGGAYLVAHGSSGGTVNCYNNIIWGNTATNGGDIYLGTSGTTNGYNNDYDSAKMFGTWGSSGNNLDNIDPKFVGVNDYHLQPTSFCIDAGNNSAPSLPLTDFEGNDRIVNGGKGNTVDIGADEYTGPLILRTPLSGTIFEVSTLINGYQPSFEWINDGTFKSFTILFSTSPTDFSGKGYLITKANIQGTKSSYTPSAGIWKKVMTSSNNNGSIRDIYWKVVGTRTNKATEENVGRHFRIDDFLAAVVQSPGDGDVLPSGTPPIFIFGVNFNVKLQLEISSVSNFSDSKKMKKFTFTVKDPNATPSFQKTLSSGQWNSIIKLIGTGMGYFRVWGWDGIKRETVSGIKSFTIQ